MQAQAYEGYFENGQFYPIGKEVQVTGRRRAFITIFEEPFKDEFVVDKEKQQAINAFFDMKNPQSLPDDTVYDSIKEERLRERGLLE